MSDKKRYTFIFIAIIVLLCFEQRIDARTSPKFGLHSVETISAISDLNIHQVRLAGEMWESLEPTKGVYWFNGLDNAIKSFSSQGVNLIVVTLRPISSWGGNEYAQSLIVPGDPTTAYSGFPSDMEAWKEFIKRVVEWYDGDDIDDMPDLTIPVKYWQIEAEWLWQWVDTIENLVEFLSQTSVVIRQADPTAKIISPAFTALDYFACADGLVPEGYVERGDGTDDPVKITADIFANSPIYIEKRNDTECLLNKGRYYFDIIDFHTYSRDASLIAAEKEWITKTIVSMDFYKPIWTLENGGPLYGYAEKKHAEEVIKRHVISFESKVSRVFWSSLDPNSGFSLNYQRLSLISEEGEKKPAYYTYKLMVSKLENSFLKCQVPTRSNIHVYQFLNIPTREPLYIAWSDEEGVPITFHIQAKKLIITHIITEPGQTEPDEEIINVIADRVTLNLSPTPVFIAVE